MNSPNRGAPAGFVSVSLGRKLDRFSLHKYSHWVPRWHRKGGASGKNCDAATHSPRRPTAASTFPPPPRHPPPGGDFPLLAASS